MRPLYVYGSGGLGETILEIAAAGGLPGYEPVGWIDDVRREGSTGPAGLPVVGGRAVFEGLGSDDAVMVAIGDNRTRLTLLQHGLARGVVCPIALHPSAVRFADVTLGPGSIVNAGAMLARHVRLGLGAIVNLSATVGHDLVGGDGIQISPGVNVAGGVRMADGVFIGPGAIVIQGRRIEAWARVGAGAVVIRDVETHTTVFGNPARVVERRAADTETT